MLANNVMQDPPRKMKSRQRNKSFATIDALRNSEHPGKRGSLNNSTLHNISMDDLMVNQLDNLG